MPIISIIVPVYKVEKYIHCCIDTILAQTFTNFELILVDDGSPDNCGKICDEYAGKDSRIRVIHQENKGLSAARNAGLDICRGKYILFCDSDDYVDTKWCESLCNSVTEHQDNYIFGRIAKVFGDENDSQMLPLEKWADIEDLTVGAFLKLHTQSRIGFACNVLYYADIIREQGLRFRSDVIIEDLPFCLEYLKHMRAVSYCGNAIYYYLQRQESTLSQKYHQDGFRKWREKYAAIQKFIEVKLPAEEQVQYQKLIAEYYIYFFLTSLENTFDKRSNLNFVQKLRYNQHVIRTTEFGHCLHHCEGVNENKRYLKLLKKGNYYVAYLYVLCARIKSNVRKVIKR